MITTSHHAPEADLAAYAVSGSRGDARFAALRAHLSDGCERCANRIGRYSSSRPVAGSRIDIPPVEDWLRPETLRLCTNVRTGMLADLQLVCGAGPFELDVVVAEHASPPSLDINGQVTRAGCIHEPVRSLELSVIEAVDRRVVGGTATDEFGEFGFAALAAQPYGLRLGDRPDAPCILIWEGEA